MKTPEEIRLARARFRQCHYKFQMEMRRLMARSFSCNICGRVFESPRGRNTHLRMKHDIKVQYKL